MNGRVSKPKTGTDADPSVKNFFCLSIMEIRTSTIPEKTALNGKEGHRRLRRPESRTILYRIHLSLLPLFTMTPILSALKTAVKQNKDKDKTTAQKTKRAILHM